MTSESRSQKLKKAMELSKAIREGQAEEIKKDGPMQLGGIEEGAGKWGDQKQVKQMKGSTANVINANGQHFGGRHAQKRLRDWQSLAGFDPWAKENRQIVANCKKHRTQGHKLSEPCKKILAMVDAQERNRKGKGGKDQGGLGKGAPYTDLDAEWGVGRDKCPHAQQYGNELLESEKYYFDKWAKGSIGEKEAYGYEYKVRPANCYGRRQKGTKYVQAPMFDTTKYKEQEIRKMMGEFFDNPELFLQRHPNSSMETIAIKAILKNIDEEEELGEVGGTNESWGIGEHEGAEMPQPLAASSSDVEENELWILGTDDIMKARQVLSKCSKSEKDAKAMAEKIKKMKGKK